MKETVGRLTNKVIENIFMFIVNTGKIVIKFFKSLCNRLNLSKESIIENVANVEEYWLEDDLASNAANFDFLHDVNFSQIESNLSAAN